MSFAQYWRCRVTVVRALKVAALIGTVLIAVNQGDVLLSGKVPPPWKIVLTYLVPYCVSSGRQSRV
jgi:hypothetical protein